MLYKKKGKKEVGDNQSYYGNLTNIEQIVMDRGRVPKDANEL